MSDGQKAARPDVEALRKYEIDRAKAGEQYDPAIIMLCHYVESLEKQNEELWKAVGDFTGNA